jgi:filamentous hemagglutinin family protein
MTLAGSTYNITQNLGTLAGGNLFFSFQYFNVGTGQRALFSTSSPGISNVISRVTGGYASSIDGTIQLTAASGAPNFFLINPSGVTFTANAVVDVPAAFCVTTANYLKFSDGNFYADPTRTSTLSTAAPEAFGFLGTTRAPVDVLGARLSAGAQGDGEFQIVAGDVTIDGAGAPAGIRSSSGPVRVIATGAQVTEVPLTGAFDSNDGTVMIQNGGIVFTVGDAASEAGSIFLSAGTLQVDGESGAARTGIFSLAGGDGGGAITVNVSGSVSLIDGGSITSLPVYSGAGGDITLNAGSLAIQGSSGTGLTGIETYTDSTSNGGAVTVNVAGAAIINNGGMIMTGTEISSGGAGDITVAAGSLNINGGAANLPTGISSVTTGTGSTGGVSVMVADTATLSNGGSISSYSYPSAAGNAGDLKVNAGSLTIDGGTSTVPTGILSDAEPSSSGNAGQVHVTTSGATTVLNGGEIVSQVFGAGSAGDLTLAAGSLSITGGSSDFVTEVATVADSGSTGNDSEVAVTTTGATTISNGGRISANSFTVKNSGNITLAAASLSIDGGASTEFTGIATNNFPGGSGNSGLVSITTTGATTLSSGGQINLDTFNTGNAGSLTLKAASLNINGEGSSLPTGIESFAEFASAGNAGQVFIDTAGATTLTGGGQIATDTAGYGRAGDVYVASASLNISGLSSGITSGPLPGSSGDAGHVSVATTGATTLLNGGLISTDTDGSGMAGDITVAAASLTINGGRPAVFTGLSSDTSDGSTGSAGVVAVNVAGTAELLNEGTINSGATLRSSGQPGNIIVNAGTLVLGINGTLSIENSATVADPKLIKPTHISIQAADIQMNGGQINAASTGNVEASAINVHYGQLLYMDPSTISTSSIQGSGGPITIFGQGPLWIEDSNITTSVSGTTNGNGGNISVSAPFIVLSSGVIQANTAAPRASGGDVTIDAQALIPSYEAYVSGGSSVTFDPSIAGLNVVQAAAPDGVNGTLDVTVPTLDLGNSLLGLTGAPAPPTALGRSLCSYRQGSSLSMAGRGGLAVSARDPLWVDAEDDANVPPTDDAGPPSAGKLSDRKTALAVIACR